MLKTRVITAAIFTPALLAVIWQGGVMLQLAVLGLVLLMLWEYLQMTLGPGQRYAKAVGLVLGVFVAAASLGWGSAGVREVLLPAGVLVVLSAVLLRPDPLEAAVRRAALLFFGASYCAGLLPYLARLRELPTMGLGLSLMALMCTWGADTGAFFAGRAFGRHRLYAKISPKKTVEGVLGGVVSAVVVAWLMRAWLAPSLAWQHAVALGVLAALLGTAGDLCESMLKRSVGVKDSSNLLPGHGGVLDRFDAVLFVAPLFFFYVSVVV